MKEFQKVTVFLFLPAIMACVFWGFFHFFFKNVPLGMGLTVGILWISMLFIGLYLWGDKNVKRHFKKLFSPAFNYFKAILLGIFCILSLLIFITLTMDYLSSSEPSAPGIPQKLAVE